MMGTKAGTKALLLYQTKGGPLFMTKKNQVYVAFVLERT
jgi:hypothetical protein